MDSHLTAAGRLGGKGNTLIVQVRSSGQKLPIPSGFWV